MTTLQRGMVIDVNLEPTQGSETGKVRPCIVVTNDLYNARTPVIQVVPLTGWSDKKALVRTNIEISPDEKNGLGKRSIADCLQTRPIDHRFRMVQMRGTISASALQQIDQALKVVFGLR